jgi:hypothetical protein
VCDIYHPFFPMENWQVWHDGLQYHLPILLQILSKGYILWGIWSCPHIHIYRNISNNLLGKENFLLHQVMYIIIEFVNIVVPFQVWWQLKYFWNNKIFKEIISLKCQNLKKLLGKKKYKNWWKLISSLLQDSAPLQNK